MVLIKAERFNTAVLIFFLGLFAHAQSNQQYTGQSIWELPDIPENAVDIGLWSLIITKYHQPELDIPHYLGLLQNWADIVNAGIQDRRQDANIVFAVNYVLFKSGPWNDHRPVSYDLDDPLADQIENRFLSNYLDRRLGNCITMPTLLLAIVERIDPGIQLSGAQAPMHLYCILNDRSNGRKWNVEATNGMDARDAYLIESFKIPQKGIDSGLYMRPLKKKEYLSILICDLAKLESERNHQKATELTDLALRLYPNNALALVQKGAMIHTHGWETLIKPINALNRDPTKDELREITRIDQLGTKYLEKAQQLGWIEPTSEFRREYLEMVSQEKKRRKSK